MQPIDLNDHRPSLRFNPFNRRRRFPLAVLLLLLPLLATKASGPLRSSLPAPPAEDMSSASLFITGARKTQRQDVLSALDALSDHPRELKLTQVRAAITALPWVQDVRLHRRLGSGLMIDITEWWPRARWHNGEKIILLAAQGQQINDDGTSFLHLPLLYGADAPQHLAQFQSLLDLVPEIAGRIVAGSWSAGHQWTLEFTDNTKVLLPRHHALAQWRRLAQPIRSLVAAEKKAGRHYRGSHRSLIIDARLPDRLFVRYHPSRAQRPDLPKSATRAVLPKSATRAGRFMVRAST